MKKITITKTINKLQIFVYGWMEDDKQLHFIAGAMIMILAHKMFSLPISIAMTVVFIAAVLNEVFDKYKHKFGLKQGNFDKADIIYTLAGGACITVILGVIHFFKIVL